MTAEIADVADFECQIVARLPLDVQRVVDTVGQLVGPVVDAERDRLTVVDHVGSAVAVVLNAVGVRQVIGQVRGLGIRGRCM